MEKPKGIWVISAIILILGLAMMGYWIAYVKQGMSLEGVPLASEILTALTALVAAYGLYRMKRWGYVASLLVAGMWVYAGVSGIGLVATKGLEFSSPIGAMSDLVVFILLLFFCCFLIGYLWRREDLFVP